MEIRSNWILIAVKSHHYPVILSSYHIIILSYYHVIISCYHDFKVELETSLGVDTKSLPREKWDTWDPTLISEVFIIIKIIVMMMMRIIYVNDHLRRSGIFGIWDENDNCHLLVRKGASQIRGMDGLETYLPVQTKNPLPIF